MPKFYTSVILLINQSKEICEKQFSVFGSRGVQNACTLFHGKKKWSPNMAVLYQNLCYNNICVIKGLHCTCLS